jgi:cell division protein FtsB
MAKTLSPRRRLTVILISFAFFFVTVAWSGNKLLRAIR